MNIEKQRLKVVPLYIKHSDLSIFIPGLQAGLQCHLIIGFILLMTGIQDMVFRRNSGVTSFPLYGSSSRKMFQRFSFSDSDINNTKFKVQDSKFKIKKTAHKKYGESL